MDRKRNGLLSRLFKLLALIQIGLLTFFSGSAMANQPPSVRIVSPGSGVPLSMAYKVKIKVDASDDKGINRVEFYIADNKVYTDSSAPYEYEFYPNQEGERSLYVIAYDTDNASTQSRSQWLRVLPNTVDRVSVDYPIQGDKLVAKKYYTIKATARDTHGIKKVEFLIDGQVKSTDTSAPYQYRWRPTSSKRYEIKVRAYDGRGASSTSFETVNVGPANTPPEVRIVRPGSGVPLSMAYRTDIEVEATDDTGVKWVEFYINNELVRRDQTRPYIYRWNPESSGEHRFHARAYDEDDAYTTTSNHWLRVLPNTVDRVSLDSPTNGSELTADQYTYIKASASDNHGITKVEFYVDGKLIGEDTREPYQYRWMPTQEKRYGLRATAYDGKGASLKSSEVYVNAINPNEPPEVKIVSPGSGVPLSMAYKAKIKVDATDDRGINKVEFYIENEKVYTDTTAPYEYEFYPQNSGDQTLHVIAYDTNNISTKSPSQWLNILPNTVDFVSLDEPPEDSVVNLGKTINLSATARDNHGIEKVEFYEGDNLLGEDTSAPYELSWKPLIEQDYTIYAQAYDGRGATSKSSGVKLNINAPPVVRVSSPRNGLTMSRGYILTIKAEAADNDYIERVEFYIEDELAHTDYDFPFEYPWKPEESGQKQFYVKAYDTHGAEAASAVYNVKVLPDSNKLDHISLESPADGTEINIGQTVQIQADAHDVDGITSVEFIINDQVVYTDESEPYSYNWTPQEDNVYRLQAKAYDQAGMNRISETHIVETPDAPNQPPAVGITSPQSGLTMSLHHRMTIKAEAEDYHGIDRVVFYVDGKVQGTDYTSPYEAEWIPAESGTFEYYAVAFDSKGAEGKSRSNTIKVLPESNRVDHVELISPADRTEISVGQLVPIVAEANDEHGIDRVEFLINGELAHLDTEAPYQYDWKVNKEDVYLIQARAIDGKQLSRISATHILETPNAPNHPPGVSLTSPADGVVLSLEYIMTIKAEASDWHGIERVEFYVEGERLFTDYEPPYEFAWDPARSGASIELYAKAFDNKGGERKSFSRFVKVLPSHTPPEITLVSPDKAVTLEAGEAIDIAVEASDPHGSIDKVELYVGDELLTELTEAPYKWEWHPDLGIFDVKAVAYNDSGLSTETPSVQVKVGSSIFRENFDSGEFGRTAPVNVYSNKNWSIESSEDGSGAYARMSGYGGDEASEDWLILDPINLDNYEGEVLLFETAFDYDGPSMMLKYSDEYDPEYDTDPYSVLWNDIPECRYPDDEFCWSPPKDSGLSFELSQVNLSDISGENISIAFVYISDGTRGGDGRLWAVDNISIESGQQTADSTEEKFEDGIPTNWTIWSETSNKDWEKVVRLREKSVGISGYGADAASKDWLIMPTMDISETNQLQLEFDYYRKYVGADIQVKISTNYVAGQNPNTARWQTLSIDFPEQDDYWNHLGPINLPGASELISIAFVYSSTGPSAGEGASVAIDNVKVNLTH